jgi:hypothetical protein
MFSQDLNKEFGFIRNSSLTTLQNSANAGKYCKSGIAYIANANTARCAEINNVTSNIDGLISN